jgi:hypothetical protein
MVLTDTAYSIYLGADMLICIFVIAALGIAMQKKHHKAMGVIVLAFLLSFFFASWIALAVSLGYLIISAIWFKSEKNKAVATVTTNKIASKEKSEKEEEADEEEPVFETKIKCRFCKKLYSSEYNGCPYCKKK